MNMGFLGKGFLERIFGSKTSGIDEISEDSLEVWFRQKTSEKLTSRESRKKEIQESFNTKVVELREAVRKLGSTELQNNNVPSRMVDFMTGNRENYIKQVNILVQNMPGLDNEFNQKFDALLDDMAKRSTRSYQVLQEFFAHETQEIAFKLKELSLTAKEFLTSDPEIIMIENTLSKISKLREARNKVSDALLSINNLNEEIKEKESEIAALEERIEESKKSKDYEQLNSIRELKKQKERRILELETSIINVFSPFSKLMKKYQREQPKYHKLLQEYSDNTLDAFSKDSRLDICDALSEAIANVESLGFNSKEQEKIRERKSSIDILSIGTLRREYAETRKTIEQAQKSLSLIPIESDIEKMNREIKSLKGSIQEVKGSITETENLISEINEYANTLSAEVPREIQQIVGVEVKVIHSTNS